MFKSIGKKVLERLLFFLALLVVFAAAAVILATQLVKRLVVRKSAV